ncbi:putative transposase [Escherichia coli 3-020-07_S4_C1]|nr:putative transposase [Escherichia coli 3-020-07_S4_C1]
MGYLKGKSSLMLYEQFGDLKFKYRNREFWCRLNVRRGHN